MKTLIVYATKSGASRKCVELLADKLAVGSVCDLSKQEPDIARYDVVILGSGVRFGKIYRPMKDFMEHNRQKLLSKRIAFFLCNAYPNTFQRVVEKNIPKELIDRALCIESFGGTPPFTSPKNGNWILMNSAERLVQSVLFESKQDRDVTAKVPDKLRGI